ncbi:hypothetical protein J437_LFUL005215 [Ladona fulva]|uniref:C2H2-type domain-containing protein n=1 Tax=Ladona fulva TaxID=123851 RepID=A0A8K0KGH5_LADFU|nr:hypothetical protein J437_LFUL005215 [Ladona fulva]
MVNNLFLGLRSFVCEDCGKSFPLKWSLDLHKRTHSRVRPFSCPTCSRAFSTHKDMRRHFLIHSDAKPYNCSLCDTKFRRKDNFERHLKNTHPEKYGIEEVQNVSDTTSCTTDSSNNQKQNDSCNNESIPIDDKIEGEVMDKPIQKEGEKKLS